MIARIKIKLVLIRFAHDIDNTAAYRVNDRHSIIVSGGCFTITNDNGDVLDRIAVKDFARSPRAGFRRIKNTVV